MFSRILAAGTALTLSCFCEKFHSTKFGVSVHGSLVDLSHGLNTTPASGNTNKIVQVDDRDWGTVTAALFLEDNMAGDAQMGVNEKQGLTCVITEANSSAYIELEFMGTSVTVAANTTISDLRYGPELLSN